MDRGSWWAVVHGVANSEIQLSDYTSSQAYVGIILRGLAFSWHPRISQVSLSHLDFFHPSLSVFIKHIHTHITF